ncbi:MAG: hypothetical protein ABI718_03485 [Acidobacteriota bacterium]
MGILKWRWFERLDYSNDLFSFLEMSRSMLRGKPLLWSNYWGDHRAIHNYYIVPLTAPLTVPFGAVGLFVALLLGFGACLVFLSFVERRVAPGRRVVYWIVAATFLLGPVSWWLIDDLPYGWHPEVLYLPVGFALVTALVTGRKRAAAVCIVVLSLIHEGAAILGWAISAVAVVEREDDQIPWRDLIPITIFWGALFVAGLFLQHSFLPRGETGRLQQAIFRLRLLDHKEIAVPLLRSLVDAVALLLTGLLPLLAGLRPRRPLWHVFVIIVLLVPSLVGSMPYTYWLPELRNHALAWGPRFTVLWTYLACVLVVSAFRGRTASIGGRRAMAVVALGFVLQAVTLFGARRYDVAARVASALEARELPWLSAHEGEILACMGKRLPTWTEVAAPRRFFAFFERQEMFWPDRLPANGLPDVAVLSTAARPEVQDGLELRSATSQMGMAEAGRTGRLEIFAVPGFKATVDGCVETSGDGR